MNLPLSSWLTVLFFLCLINISDSDLRWCSKTFNVEKSPPLEWLQKSFTCSHCKDYEPWDTMSVICVVYKYTFIHWLINVMGAGTVQWWECSYIVSHHYGLGLILSQCHVDWVCCWFSPCSVWGFFSGFSSFPPSTKTNISLQIPLWPAG